MNHPKNILLFEEVLKSGEIETYESIEKEVNSEEFKQKKTYLLLPFQKKWEQTEEFSKAQEFNKLKASEKVKWYFSVVDSKKFEEVLNWKLTFADDFETGNLDKNTWLTRFYYGDTVLNEAYSLSEDKQFTTDGENIKIENSILKIETKEEKITGKAWNPMIGFVPKEFDYTSGTINTGKSFRQKYGKFRAKIKMSSNKKITQAFWMVGSQIIPHIDVVKFTNNSCNFGNFWKTDNNIEHHSDKVSGSKLHNKFFIYELEWNANELIWRINNLEIKRTKNGVPDEELYLQFSSGIFGKLNGEQFPASMEIDWVKCYSLV